MVQKGLFIVTEGIDGCGKTTQANLLSNWIFSYTKKIDAVVTTREPSNTKFSKEIYERIAAQNKDSSSMAKDRMLELFVLDREEHVNNVVAPALSKGHVVVCDRYKYSNIAYQSTQGVLTSHVIAENAGFPIPDLVLFFNLSPEKCVERMEKSGKTMDKFEKLEFLEKVKAQFVKLPQLLPNEKFITINANQSIDAVHADAVKAVKPLVDAWLK